MKSPYIITLNLRPAFTFLSSQKRFSTIDLQTLLMGIENCTKSRGFSAAPYKFGGKCFTNHPFVCSRTFSTLSQVEEVSVTKGDLYSQTARPLDDFRVDRKITKYSEGLKSCRIFDNPNIVRVPVRERETFFDKVYRYMDIGGFFTMLNSRKVHILRTTAIGRSRLMVMTEFERKQSLIMRAVLSLLLYYVYYCYVKHKLHIYDRHPSPELPTFEFTRNRLKDFTWHGSLPFQYPKGRCKECRWLELECKKRCYDELLNQGHRFIIQNPMQIPRRQLLPSPYPPST